MQLRPQIILVCIAAQLFLSVLMLADELPSLTLDLNTGQKLRAKLDPRTNVDRLWLRFGTAETAVRRGFDWSSVAVVHEGDRVLTQRELLQIADAARQPPATVDPQRIIVRSSDSPSDVQPRAVPELEHGPTRVATVTFDAMLGNWDADVSTDGLLIQVTALDGRGESVPVHGILNVELYSMRRVDQDSFAHGRVRQIGLLQRWSTQVECDPTNPNRGWVRLPFQAVHPEFDVDWAPFGLVHIEFVAAGHGVFHHSIDGLRIRPWAPLRDALERQTKTRFFPAELSQ